MEDGEGCVWPAEDGMLTVVALRLGHDVTSPPPVNAGKHPQKEANLPAGWNAGFLLWLPTALQILLLVTSQNIYLPGT